MLHQETLQYVKMTKAAEQDHLGQAGTAQHPVHDGSLHRTIESLWLEETLVIKSNH